MNADWRKLLSGTEILGDERELTDEFAAKFGYAFAVWLARSLETTPDQLVIAVGRDPRSSGTHLSRALIKGLTAADSDVLDCDLCSGPALQAMLFRSERPAGGCIMVTGGRSASHVNGFKLETVKGLPGADDLLEMIDMAASLKLPERLVTETDAGELYREKLAAMARNYLEDDVLRPLLGMHVVVNACGGTGGFFAEFLEELGAETTGSFALAPSETVSGEPERRERELEALSKVVVEQQADLGVLLNADCATVSLVDGAGRAISGNRLIALISAILLDKKPGATIVTDSVTSSGLSRFISEWGGIHYRFRRGSRNVIEEARRLNEEGIDCPLAIETSGHSAFCENRFANDGVYLALRIICAAYDLKRGGKMVSDLLIDLSEPVESEEIRLRIASDDPTQASRDVIETVLSHTLEDAEWRLATDSREGVRILFNLEGGVENAWFQLRMSVYDPCVMVLNAESDVPGGVQRMLKDVCTVLEMGESELDLAPLRERCAIN